MAGGVLLAYGTVIGTLALQLTGNGCHSSPNRDLNEISWCRSHRQRWRCRRQWYACRWCDNEDDDCHHDVDNDVEDSDHDDDGDDGEDEERDHDDDDDDGDRDGDGPYRTSRHVPGMTEDLETKGS